METPDASIPSRDGDTPTTLRYTCRICEPDHPLGRRDLELFIPACQIGGDDTSIATFKYIYDVIRQERDAE
jgi:hypothetical protein